MLHALVAGGSGQDPFWPMHRAPLADGKRAAVPHEDGTVRLFELAPVETRLPAQPRSPPQMAFGF